MLKRTTGRLLLALLVTTGLAGTLNNSSLSQKERKLAITLIKNSRTEVVNAVTGLSVRQLNYKVTPQDQSIGEIIITMASLEQASNAEIKSIMDQPSNSEQRLKIALTDEQVLASNNYTQFKTGSLTLNNIQLKDPGEAMKKFLVLRNNYIKYIRTSTEDLRNHVLSTPVGWIDCYQYYLLLADRSLFFADQINTIKSLPSFPKK